MTIEYLDHATDSEFESIKARSWTRRSIKRVVEFDNIRDKRPSEPKNSMIMIRVSKTQNEEISKVMAVCGFTNKSRFVLECIAKYRDSHTCHAEDFKGI